MEVLKMLTKAFIPYKGYYSTPFCRWQGSMFNENSYVLGANTSRRWLAEKNWDPKMFDYLILGMTIIQKDFFFGSTWVTAMIGAPNIPGTITSQACSTSTTCIYQASAGIETGFYKNVCCLMTDRLSNGPHLVWANPTGPGGEVESQNKVMESFNRDPWAKNSMIQTAENVAKEAGITREQCDAVTLRRYEQYTDALADDRAFHKRYMFPAEVHLSKKKTMLVEEDEGIITCTQEGLAGLKAVLPDGVHTFGSQTHPADGNCTVVVTTREKAKELSADSNIEIQVISYGYGRSKKGFMAQAVVPALRMALDHAGIAIDDVKAIKTHNPFATNDIYLAQQFNIDVNGFNNYGSSIIFGHPQAATAGRCIIEGIEEVVILGGGYFAFTGCAAGDTAAAMVFQIG